ncbi:MAG: hypothetical protein ABR502_08150 [Chitinophagaceae bacterium]
MKTNVMPSIVKIERKELRKLMKQVDETLADDVISKQSSISHKKFGIVDMWNCRKNMRTCRTIR